MLYIKKEDLKIGMRLARPIYNRSGVLLYERGSKLTENSINSIENFGLIGIFVLEPAEPIPIMTEDDLDFERFQAVEVFAIRDELLAITKSKSSPTMSRIILDIIRAYGRREQKLNFIQGLRSPQDYFYKRALNIAILCAMMSNQLPLNNQERQDLMMAALLYDIYYVSLQDKWEKADEKEREEMKEKSVEGGLKILSDVYHSNPGLKRMFVQTHKLLSDFEKRQYPEKKPSLPVRILSVAVQYDEMTAMKENHEPASEVEAFKLLFDYPEVFDEETVEALLQSITFLAPGTCIELNTGEKGLVLKSNDEEPLRPTILLFEDNSIIDMSNALVYADLEIANIMKTMDNRYVMDLELLKKQGLLVETKSTGR